MRHLAFVVVLLVASVAQATDVSLIISESFVSNLGGSWGTVHMVTDDMDEWEPMQSAFTGAPGYDKYLLASFTIPAASEKAWFRFAKTGGGYEYIEHDNLAAHAAANPTILTLTATADAMGNLTEFKAVRSPGGSGTATYSSELGLTEEPEHMAPPPPPTGNEPHLVQIADGIFDILESLLTIALYAAGVIAFIYGMLVTLQLTMFAFYFLQNMHTWRVAGHHLTFREGVSDAFKTAKSSTPNLVHAAHVSVGRAGRAAGRLVSGQSKPTGLGNPRRRKMASSKPRRRR